MKKCPDCQGYVDGPLHSSVHEMWQLRMSDMEENERQRKMRENAMEVEIVFQGTTYRGTVYPMGESA